MLFCSGGTFTPRAQAFADSVAERVLTKPLRRSTLDDAIARFCI